MKRTLASSLILLLSISACSKKEEAIPTPTPSPNTCSYTVDGRTAAGKGRAYFQGPGNAGIDDRLTITLTSSLPSGGNEVVTLIFNKAPGTPESAYQLQTFNMNHGLGGVYYNYSANTLFTLAKTSTGGYSGTFSGFSPSTSTNASSTITNGVFTNISL